MSKFDWSSAKRFGKKVAGSLQEAADTVTKKTEEAVNTQKIKSEISRLGRANEKDFAEMGRLVYEIYKKGEMEDADLRAISEEIEKREILISEKQEALTAETKTKTCHSCGSTVDEDAVFCPDCGQKLVTPEPKEETLYEEVPECVPEEESDSAPFEDMVVETETVEEIPEEEILAEDIPDMPEEEPLVEEIPEEV